jgi:hypothetical protein
MVRETRGSRTSAVESRCQRTGEDTADYKNLSTCINELKTTHEYIHEMLLLHVVMSS